MDAFTLRKLTKYCLATCKSAWFVDEPVLSLNNVLNLWQITDKLKKMAEMNEKKNNASVILIGANSKHRK